MSLTKKEQEGLDLMVAYRQTFSSESGQKVLADLKKRHSDRPSFTANDPYATAFKEGERNVVLMLLSMLSIDEKKINERIENVKKNLLKDV